MHHIEVQLLVFGLSWSLWAPIAKLRLIVSWMEWISV